MDKVIEVVRFIGGLPLANLLVILCLALVALAGFCVHAAFGLAKDRRP